MPDPEFTGIKACVFDAYGTLFDVHSAVGRYRDKLGQQADTVSALWRTKQLEYTWLRSLTGRHRDMWQVTGDALDYALETSGVDDAALRSELLNAYLALDAYPEVPGVLRTLKQAGYRLTILSNGSPAMLDAAVTQAGIGDALEGWFSVEEVGVYKPDPRVYQLAVDRLGVASAQISFQSSNAWDAYSACAFGFRVAWINRFGQRPERLPATPQAELRTLSELPALLGIG